MASPGWITFFRSHKWIWWILVVVLAVVLLLAGSMAQAVFLWLTHARHM